MQAYGSDPDRGAFDQWPGEVKQRELYRLLRWLQTLERAEPGRSR
jgi:hypothetical protein